MYYIYIFFLCIIYIYIFFQQVCDFHSIFRHINHLKILIHSVFKLNSVTKNINYKSYVQESNLPLGEVSVITINVYLRVLMLEPLHFTQC